MGGQPGAGKTELETIARTELGGNVISCNADIFRDYHPKAEEIKSRFEPYYPEITAKYAQDWNNGLRAYCEANRLNYILETTFSSGAGMNKTIDELQQKGYGVEIKLLAIHPRLSLLGTHVRFEEMKARENTGRAVGKEAHDSRYNLLAPTLYTVQSAALYNKLQIYGRSIEPLGDTYKSGVHLLGTNPPNALQVFQEEVDRKWSHNLLASFKKSMELVIGYMKARNAPEKEIKAFREEMRAEYPTQKQLQLQVARQIKEQETAEQLQRRLTGQLPQITIGGTDFTIDLRLAELRETAKPHNKIDLREMQLTSSGDSYLFFYHTNNHSLYEPAPDIKVLPKNVVVAEIPNEIKLDPVGFARANGLDITAFVKENPIQRNLTAIIKPLSESGLPELIKENLRQAQSLPKGRNAGEDLDQSHGISR